MAKAVQQFGSLTVGFTKLGMFGDGRGSVKQEVHDADTIITDPLGNVGVRFLGVDAPEISLPLPGNTNFVQLSNSAWGKFLGNPWNPQISSELKAYLSAKLLAKDDVITNHFEHALAAERYLEQIVQLDIEALKQDKDSFTFFLTFAYEVMDRYGRFLCFINRYQPEGFRPLTYNERLLQAGYVTPFFIWPNINPFRKHGNILEAVIKPGTADQVADGEPTLKTARQWVKNARKEKVGIFESGNELVLYPFELRFLSRSSIPERWVIDLGKNDNVLVPPQRYFTIENPEDRLFINPEHVPLFVEAGWEKSQL